VRNRECRKHGLLNLYKLIWVFTERDMGQTGHFNMPEVYMPIGLMMAFEGGNM
jgi:hypothetical protein